MKLEKELSVDEIESILSKKFTIDEYIAPRCFVFPSGNVLHLDSFTPHSQVTYYLERYFEENEIYLDIRDYMKYLNDLGVIRVNLQSEGFIFLNKDRPTYEQYGTLEKLLDAYLSTPWRHSQYFRLISRGSGGDYEYHNYEHTGPNAVDTDYIIKVIKRYYTTGKLVEKLEDSGEDC